MSSCQPSVRNRRASKQITFWQLGFTQRIFQTTIANLRNLSCRFDASFTSQPVLALEKITNFLVFPRTSHKCFINYTNKRIFIRSRMMTSRMKTRVKTFSVREKLNKQMELSQWLYPIQFGRNNFISRCISYIWLLL